MTTLLYTVARLSNDFVSKPQVKFSSFALTDDEGQKRGCCCDHVAVRTATPPGGHGSHLQHHVT